MKKTNERGFTLIELLVVISIIGLLSTMAVISLNSARSKARDAKRVSDIKGISTIFEMQRANLPAATQIPGCDLAAYKLTTDCTDAEFAPQKNNFKDPSGTVACQGTAGVISTAPCAYSVSTALGATAVKYDDYQICAYLENGSAGLTSGMISVATGGVLRQGCN